MHLPRSEGSATHHGQRREDLAISSKIQGFRGPTFKGRFKLRFSCAAENSGLHISSNAHQLAWKKSLMTVLLPRTTRSSVVASSRYGFAAATRKRLGYVPSRLSQNMAFTKPRHEEVFTLRADRKTSGGKNSSYTGHPGSESKPLDQT